MVNGRIGAVLLGGFFGAATCILLVTGTSLTWPGTPLDLIWSLAEDKHADLLPYRRLAGGGFLLLSVVMVLASFGCFTRREWGRRLAITIFAANAAGNAAQFLSGHVVEGAIGVSVSGALIVYLTRPHTRRAFDSGPT